VLIPNAFDAGSAKVIARQRPVAIGTSSAGIARGLGYVDGENISRDEMLAAVKRIVDAVDVPVTADVESGYGDAGGTAQRLLEIGVIGLNLEDADHRGGGLLSVEDACANIAAIRAVAGTGLMINARVDSWLEGATTPRSWSRAATPTWRQARTACSRPGSAIRRPSWIAWTDR